MSRIMRSAFDLGSLVMQHAEDIDLAENGTVNDGIISTKLGLQGITELAEKIIIERDLSLLEDFNLQISYFTNFICKINRGNKVREK